MANKRELADAIQIIQEAIPGNCDASIFIESGKGGAVTLMSSVTVDHSLYATPSEVSEALKAIKLLDGLC